MQDYDVIIIGAGAAGCAAALSLAPLKVALVSATLLGGDCSSLWSQGGIAAAVGARDSALAHAYDTLIAADGIGDSKVTATYTAEAEKTIGFLEMNGVQFDRQGTGYDLSREGGHSDFRVLKAGSDDGFGKALMPALVKKVEESGHISLYVSCKAVEILKDVKGRAAGLRVLRQRRTEILRTRAIIIATGGAAALYSETTNPLHNTGSGIALAARAGAMLADLEFVQFHPTALLSDRQNGKPMPLLTEALRGHGAKLVNDKGDYFMAGEHALADLAPRDIVSRAVFRQIHTGRQVFLDCRKIDTYSFKNLQANACKAGFDPAYDLLPVAPAAHYHMGGISTDMNGRTSVRGLWAIGEAASTGFHGANRLASNSLLEAVIMGRRAAGDIKKARRAALSALAAHSERCYKSRLPKALRYKTILAVRYAMSEYVGVMRNKQGLTDAIAFFDDLSLSIGGLDYEIEDMVSVCSLIAKAALARIESRGGHFRSDFPFSDKMQQQRSYIASAVIRNDDSMEVSL